MAETGLISRQKATLQELIQSGKEIGLSGGELHELIKEQQTIDRQERLQRRQHKRDIREARQAREERQSREWELEMKLRLEHEKKLEELRLSRTPIDGQTTAETPQQIRRRRKMDTPL